jgi:hypothetical protein
LQSPSTNEIGRGRRTARVDFSLTLFASRVIYVHVIIKKVTDYAHAMKKFPDTRHLYVMHSKFVDAHAILDGLC